MRVFGSEKMASGRPNRKAKWCKMQVMFLKTDKTKGMKDEKQRLFTYFLTYIFAITGRKKEKFCKKTTI